VPGDGSLFDLASLKFQHSIKVPEVLTLLVNWDMHFNPYMTTTRVSAKLYGNQFSHLMTRYHQYLFRLQQNLSSLKSHYMVILDAHNNSFD
jgi:hypothetical protein